jgi:hypothetical protein
MREIKAKEKGEDGDSKKCVEFVIGKMEKTIGEERKSTPKKNNRYSMGLAGRNLEKILNVKDENMTWSRS